ncbi:poly-beta-1,6-N-acetyl-D-glucosamine biosynthesis protein PgaD [Solilutibacter silvestris]|uniref:Poly-beta-1,6-N-acetyl-D-glucosamine biosynthesis protein PgaD n=1 Tax=Solilutibacter silvestris TaxID=1645665 RepID=A0A2K1Q0I1_9GAMM|nr:poly-beta-1,6-N-acetyl-D-glucosamine biosynthesis protein PgaD [Lysobacter silvestris]PNS08552.1 poly-beta-1,6-N-acetyl-D-glucosamine biosynthesis protein PgaD [Lysobacter silvestris]
MVEARPPIINARRELGRGRRMLSDVATLLLWVGWILLWIPALHTLREAHRLNVDWGLAAQEAVDTITPISLTHSALLVLGTCALLLLWGLLPNRKPAVPKTETLEEESLRLQVPRQELQDGRDSRICVVHHDDDGAINSIEHRQ